MTSRIGNYMRAAARTDLAALRHIEGRTSPQGRPVPGLFGQQTFARNSVGQGHQGKHSGPEETLMRTGNRVAERQFRVSGLARGS